MSPSWTVFSSSCPSRASLARVANKWTAMIVILLHEEPLRFGELHRKVEGITKKVLVDTLRALDRDGMLVRAVDDDGHARYRLTPLGRTLHEPLQALRIWAESHVDEVLDAQDRYDDEADRRLLGGSDGAGVSAAVRPTDASPRGDILQG
ncbi:transcriptional regulator [Microbacterium foliorum]|uniref:Putative HTH-type transcriptional regulator YybR n=1 Tax=Microbacterium foliorum TaxID=104336 RepID=A0A0F0KEB3_9MICO|nr:helix-turn-helix domain-containing protein [Microbacterium foliorum]AXL11263.1 transcriptional regulator [Microbacterium foliorum]KJL19188.1 putative HTH-type transcriptional regulator YybR [Microbacterium foliorum]CAH0185140.1 putative HTH-type transcriptional regulator YybR [Microbacterium foliorum]CAH0256178.1 putative HTH-type transcriptional regulator YybR [Microbacterium foliorum]